MQRHGKRWVLAGVVVVALALGATVYWRVVKPIGEGPVCYVTGASLTIDAGSDQPTRYSGTDDAPGNPQAGDRYNCPSGGLPGEVMCVRVKRIIGYDLEDCDVLAP